MNLAILTLSRIPKGILSTLLYNCNCAIRVQLKLLLSCSKIMVSNFLNLKFKYSWTGCRLSAGSTRWMKWVECTNCTLHRTFETDSIRYPFYKFMKCTFFFKLYCKDLRYSILKRYAELPMWVMFDIKNVCNHFFEIILGLKNQFSPIPKVLIMSLNLLQLSFAFYNIVRKVAWADSCNNLGVSWHNLA